MSEKAKSALVPHDEPGGRESGGKDLHPAGSPLSFAGWVKPFLAVLTVAAAAFCLSLWLDLGSNRAGAHSLGALLDGIFNPDVERARSTLGGLGEIMAAVLGLALTVSSIIVQLAATRFSPHVTSLFFRARANLLVLSTFVVSNIFVLWVNFSIAEDFVPRWGTLASMALLTLCLLLLFPYFAYVFNFLQPRSIIDRICRQGLEAAGPEQGSAPLSSRQLATAKGRSGEAIERLANIGLNAIQQQDKTIASDAVHALCVLGRNYGQKKLSATPGWHEIPLMRERDPDFVSLSNQAVVDLEERKLWLEWKLLRQYQMLFNESLGPMRDLGYLIAIETRRLGEAAGQREDFAAIDLVIRYFNTYLRSALNANDTRSAYNLLHQYRQLAEFALRAEVTPPLRDALERRVVEIARFMRYYAGLASERTMNFVVEVTAHDLGALCELAFTRKSPAHSDLLAVFLSVDDHGELGSQERALRGVRRAQVKLATSYLRANAQEAVEAIRQDMAEEPAERLRAIWQELAALRSAEFWEVNDRGTNFDYLDADKKRMLPVFFAGFPALSGEEHPPARRHTILPVDI